MSHSIETKTVDILQAQKEVIRETLEAKRKSGVVKSQDELNKEKERLFKKIDSTEPKPFMKVREQKGISDARSFNDTYEEVSYDLQTIFKQLNHIDETINKHQRLNQSLIHNLQLRIKKVEEELGQHERTYNLYDSHQMYVENFIDANSVESDLVYYTEREGKQLPVMYMAKLDNEREAIKLPTVISQNTLIGPSGVQLGKLKIIKQLGSGYNRVINPENDLSKAIDNSKETFWAESLQVDAPIRVQMGAEYYHINFGAVCEIEVQFDYLTQLNELSFLMFGEYPLDIIAVRYYETDSEDEVAKEIISPNQAIKGLSPRSIADSTSFQFDDIYAKRLRILINQRHYIKTDFIASQRNQRNLALWMQESEHDIHEDAIFKPILLDRKSSLWKQFHRSINGKLPDIDFILGELDKDSLNAISKYEYNYGLYNLSIKRNEYQTVGVYVSKEVPAEGNVKLFSLETEEEHPEPIPGLRMTDIEYYVHDGENWHPILPKNQEKVISERLFPELSGGTYHAVTRFDIESGLVIRKNGEAITNFTQLSPSSLSLSDYQASAIYTAEYTPVPSAREINFLDILTPRTIVQEFRGTSTKGTVELSSYPFVNKSELNLQGLSYNPTYLNNEANGYLPLKIHLIDKEGYHIMQPIDETEKGMRIENVTDYFNPDVSHLQVYNENQDVFYQYRVTGNKIEFNKAIPSTTRIIVEYPYLVSHVRTKAILRRNIHRFYGLTPILNKYVAHFQTLR